MFSKWNRSAPVLGRSSFQFAKALEIFENGRS